MVENKLYTDKQTVELLRNYIDTHYQDLKNSAKSITKSRIWEELLQETILALLYMKRVPEDIFIRGREFLYIYVTMKRIYYRNNSNFKTQHSFQGHTEIGISKEIQDGATPYDFNKEVIYNNVYTFIQSEVAAQRIALYDSKVFLMYYFPEYAKEYMKLPAKKYKLLQSNSTYRGIQQVTGINFQSIRYTVLQILELVKESFDFDIEPEYDIDAQIEPKKQNKEIF